MDRRLSAILAADVVGYSRLMGHDEEETLVCLKAYRDEVTDPAIARHKGRIVKLMGDGMLTEFSSVVDAVRCAIDIQKATSEHRTDLPEHRRILMRIGINLGDVIIDDEDIYGDGVNLAARLEGLCNPGGICISSIVHESIGNRIGIEFTDTGEHMVKNIDKPIRVWRWPAAVTDFTDQVPLALPEKPSIAILPFDNMSSDPEQEFFTEGIVEDIITELSKFRSFFVIARNSSFAFKDQALEVREISKRLGVRYVVEGSVRRAGNRVRITAQLIDAIEDTHLWAERYDRDLEDIFAVQDEVTHAIVTTIEPQLANTERQRARRKPPENLDAWATYQRGLWHLYRYTGEDATQAIAFLERAVKLDPGFASAHAGLALALYYHVLLGFSNNRKRDLVRAQDEGKQAVMLDTSDPFSHFALSRTYNIFGEHETAVQHCKRAISLNPSYATAHFGKAHSLMLSGRAEEALPSNTEAMRLSPHDPLLWAYMASRAIALTLLGRYEEGLEWARKALQQPNAALFASVAEVAALGLLGRIDEAGTALARTRQFKPDITMDFVLEVLPITDPECKDRFTDGLRKAGLPE